MQTIPRILAPLGVVSGITYGAIARFRNAFYDNGTLRQKRLQSPVISIGNITAGGNGKTPLVIYTARKLMELGRIPVVLTRGYGRIHPGTSLVIHPDTKLQASADTIGDEPMLIRRQVPDICLGLSKNRFSAGSLIERQKSATAFILDDGFQHRKLFRDLDIVVIDASQPFRSNRVIPRGSLREPVTGLRRCNAVILNGTVASANDSIRSEIEALGLKADIFCCSQFIKRLVSFEQWKRGPDNDKKGDSDNIPIESVYLVAALGNPVRFQTDVLDLGIRISGSRFYRDHYRLRPNDWNTCIRTARDTGAEAMLVSEKDAVKISEPPDYDLFVAVQAVHMENEEAYVGMLNRVLNVQR